MKREIAFKGKLSHSKEWIEGNLIIAQNGKPYIIPFDIFEPDGHHLIIDSDNPFWVDEDTVSQFINQTDKKGKKIFEGDFIKYNQHKGYVLPNFIAEVQWINDSACFGYKRNDVPDWSSPTPFVEHDELKTDFLNFVEVVGNIWDNEISELVAQHSI